MNLRYHEYIKAVEKIKGILKPNDKVSNIDIAHFIENSNQYIEGQIQ